MSLIYLLHNSNSNSNANISEASTVACLPYEESLAVVSIQVLTGQSKPFSIQKWNQTHVEEIKAVSCRGEARLSMNNPQLGLHFHFYKLIYEASMIRCGHLANQQLGQLHTGQVRPGQTSPHTLTHDVTTNVQFDIQDSRLEQDYSRNVQLLY